jgi:endonuclease/exonuclease/phosphatase family metal-dependent hydrolase
MPELTIASFNCHAGLQARRNGVCEPYDLDTVLRGIDADVVVLQESWTPDGGVAAVRRVGESTGAEVFELRFGRSRLDPWPHVPRDGSGLGEVGLAVLSRIPAEAQGRLPVGTVLSDPTPERGGLHVVLDVGGTKVDLIGVHLSSRLPYGPPIQLRRLAAQLPPPGRPGIVAGDCNFWGPGVQSFLPGWRRAVRGRTWPAGRPHSQIDHILVRAADGTEVLRGEVLPPLGSDHRAVRATLRFP